MVPLGLYTGQLVLNWAWPPIFFGTRQMGLVSVACRWPMVGWAPLGGHGASHPRRGQGLKAGQGRPTALRQHLLSSSRGPVSPASCFRQCRALTEADGAAGLDSGATV